MSTFDGLVTEFPDIRVDFFRNRKGLRPPLACFLSHIHSDHLAGLETLRSPFVYCSAATREMLLQLEKYPCRINYAKGILEARKQTYKHLKKVLKPIPLETPTIIELEPGNHIQVVLFDANHCPGSVMFLIEGHGKAVLYTGDVRSEPWFVNALAHSPCLIEYCSGIKTLDKIYLDTSFIEDIKFQTKAEGLRELLQKVSRYPPDTIFHLQAWTFGYEAVWIALSKALNSKIHVDDYKMRIYNCLKVKDPENRYGSQFHRTPEAPGLVGFMCGNTEHQGCLTADMTVRLHSCEKGSYCDVVQNSTVVWIQPIIAHLPNGYDLAEIGVGGGGEDLEREAELEYVSAEEIQMLSKIIRDNDDIPEDLKEKIQSVMFNSMINGRNVSLELDISSFGQEQETTITGAVQSMANKTKLGRGETALESTATTELLPKTVRFPYSRHSSYPELCHLVDIFRPNDVWPCTVNVTDWVKNNITIEERFGRYCSGDVFQHDVKFAKFMAKEKSMLGDSESQATASSQAAALIEEPDGLIANASVPEQTNPRSSESPIVAADEVGFQIMSTDVDDAPLRKRTFDDYQDGADTQDHVDEFLLDSQASTVSERTLEIRRNASSAILWNARKDDWKPIGLMSTTDNHSLLDFDLGNR